jgi:hypothetical protein
MSTTRLAIAVASLALMSAGASAQVGFRIGGGGLGIGLGLPTPPLFRGRESPDTGERYQAPRRSERVQRKRNTDDDDVKTAKKTPAPDESKEAKSHSENSSIVTVGSDHDKTTPAPKESKETKSQSENSSIVTIGSDHDKTTPVTEQRKTDLAKSDTSKSSNENSTIASVASSATANAEPVEGLPSTSLDTDASGKTVETCKRYFPTVGQTITVPCQ